MFCPTRNFRRLASIVFLFSAATSCNEPEPAQGQWIRGTEAEKLNTIEKQFRGFDVAMAEVGSRYQELYWAGRDRNWEYAGYQLEKIGVAIRNAMERRPARSASAEKFLGEALPLMKTGIDSKDTAEFARQFSLFTAACNRCHAEENVPFFQVAAPVTRHSAVKKK
jgi:hypothetical protein